MANGTYCFVSGKEIHDDYVDGAATVRPVSLDMRVDCVIKKGKRIRSDRTPIKPQEMVTVILKGQIKMPENCFGIAYPKTSLCQKGIHVLNTGIVDPGYYGYLSTVAINYSNEIREIRKDEEYLRLVIYKNKINFPEVEIKELELSQYIEERELESKSYPKTFLDLPKTVGKLVNKATKKVTRNVWKTFLTMLGLIVLVSIGIALASLFIGNSNIKELSDSEVLDYKINQKLDTIETQYQEIMDRLKAIEDQKSDVIEGANSNGN